MLEYSLVIPVFNEEESIRPLWDEIAAVMGRLKRPFEVIFVDDASDDATPRILKELSGAHPDIIRIIKHPQRLGQTKALRSGFDQMSGRIAVTLDADLQNDPHDIPKLVEKLNQGFDCVCGWRKCRQDTFVKARLSKLGNVLQRLFTGMSIHDVSCTLRVYHKRCVKDIPLNWEGQHRFIPLSLSLQGYKIAEVMSHHRLRQFGQTKYSHKRVGRVMVDFFRVLAVRGRA